MDNNNHKKDISVLLETSLKKAREKLIEKEKKNDGYLVIAGKDGKIMNVPAKDL